MCAVKWSLALLWFTLTACILTLADAAQNDSSYSYVETHLERSSFIFGLTRMANQSNGNGLCHTQLKNLGRGILRREPWAMKVLDSSGTKPSGFTFGNNKWLGSPQTCQAVQKTVPISLSNRMQDLIHYELVTELSSFDVNYRVLYLRHTSPWQLEVEFVVEKITSIGLCLPSICTNDEILELASHYIDSGLFVDNSIYDIKPEALYIKDLKVNRNISLRIIIAVVAFTVAMLIYAKYLHTNPYQESKEKPSSVNISVASVNGVIKESESNVTSNRFKMLVQCFDVQENWKKMFELKNNNSNAIPAINGLRSLYSFLIVSMHVGLFSHYTMTNRPYWSVFVEPFLLHISCIVDVFFTISGFLQVYNFIRNTRQMEIIRGNNLGQNLKEFLKMLLHRFMRLTPPYFVIACLNTLLYAYYSDTSVFHDDDHSDENCSKFWWRNVFHIQNLFQYNEICLPWSWSLATEIQFFILSTILLLIYTKHPKFSRTTSWALVAFSLVCHYIAGFNTEFQIDFDVVLDSMTEIYLNPFLRVLPYMIGALAGGFLAERQAQLKISGKQEQFIWHFISGALLLFKWPINISSLSWLKSISILALGRLIFSVSVCWIIMASATGRSCWWSRFLEARVFQHLNRLTYTIYLTNAFVITLFIGATRTGLDFSVPLMAVLVPGFFFLAYLISVIFSLCFEIPYCNWSSRSLKGHNKKIL